MKSSSLLQTTYLKKSHKMSINYNQITSAVDQRWTISGNPNLDFRFPEISGNLWKSVEICENLWKSAKICSNIKTRH